MKAQTRFLIASAWMATSILGLTAYASAPKPSNPVSIVSVKLNAQGMPTCLGLSDKDALVLKWKRDLYARDIYVARASALQNRVQASSGSARGSSRSSKISCENIAGLADLVNDKDMKWTLGSPSLSGAPIPPSALLAFAQIVKGGNVYHPESTGAEYLSRHPISEYTRAIDRDLASKYGMGFTSEIYRSYLELRPEYRAFESRIQSHLQDTPSAPTLGQRAPDVTVMLANGYMQGKDNNRLKPLEDKLRAEGLKVVVFKMDSIGSMATNVALLKPQILEQVQTTNKLILMAGSKGVPELLQAVVEVARENPVAASKIKGVVNLSGMIEGSFLLDWGMKFPQKIFVEKEMRKSAKAMGIDMTTTDGLRDMMTKSLGDVMPTTLSQLPRSVTYFNVLGVPGGDGLVREKPIAALQNSVSRTRVGAHGANDGYIEFPGTEIPNTLSLNLYTVTFNSSHILLDGWYGDRDLTNPLQLDLVVRALFNSILDLIN